MHFRCMKRLPAHVHHSINWLLLPGFIWSNQNGLSLIVIYNKRKYSLLSRLHDPLRNLDELSIKQRKRIKMSTSPQSPRAPAGTSWTWRGWGRRSPRPPQSASCRSSPKNIGCKITETRGFMSRSFADFHLQTNIVPHYL